MLLKYIKFVNFRQYKDEQIISFSTDPNKNVTVVLGENTCGKTTLVQAMNWVLYNDILFDDDILVNRELLEEVAIWEEVVAEVEIRIKHNELDYVINRKQSYQKDDMGRIKKVKSNVSMVEVRDSNTKIVAPTEISEKINSIIPFDLSNYFFFTGEKIKNVTKKRDLSGAVKRLMGLDALVNAEKHLNIESSQGVYKVFARDLENDNQEEIDSLDEKINKADRENVELEEQLVSLNGELDKYTSRRDELRSKMQEYDKMNSLQNDIDSKKSMLNYFKEDIVRNEKDMVTAFSDKIYFVYAKVLASKSLDTLNSLSDKGESEALPSVNAKTIDEILKRKKCICGNEFCDGDDTYKTLINAKDYYPPKSLGTCISDFKHDLKKYSDNLNGYYSNFDSKYKNKI